MRTTWEDPPGGGGGLALPALTGVTRKLVWINGLAWLVLMLLMRFAPNEGVWVYDVFVLGPALWWDSFPLVPFWQVATYGFLHTPSQTGHVLFNLLTLYFFGTALEGLIGSRRFLFTYMAALLLGGLVQLTVGLVSIANEGTAGQTLGASGAVMAVLIAMATLQPDMRVIFILFPLRLRTLALIVVGIDVFRMIMGGSGVAWQVHLAGAAYGFAAVKLGWIWRDPIELLARRKAARQVQRERDDEHRLDELLARIHERGLNSLTESEKAFLKRVSKRD
jgi:membrane associated rhomboid family serine protease